MRRDVDFWRGNKNPFSVFDEMDRLFTRFAQPWDERGQNLISFNPVTEVEEKNDHFLISVDVPGIKREDVKIEVTNNQLVISGERRDERLSKETSRTERFYGRFERTFTLPRGTDPDKIEARYENGVLQLAVPKVEAARPKTIEVQDGKNEGFFGRFLGKSSTPQ